ncbi:MAG: glycosyl hydrolase 108 family protein [Rhodocyclaceae bacterium]|nr:glycosyl hydrolase 108 family protein [Rhodocyclaceae bacterium]
MTTRNNEPLEHLLAEIIRREGGYVNHPADRGGATNFGVTAQTLGGWRKLGRAATVDEVKALTEAEARAIYRQQYITAPGFETITHPALLNLLVDSAVHSGPKRAVQWLQMALGVAAADGVIGTRTRAAIAAADQETLYRKVLAQRLRHLGRLITDDPKQAAFAAGWMNRMAEFVEA